MIHILVNGQDRSSVSAMDRGLLYGHTVFETIAVKRRHALLLDEHLARLSKGARTLFIPYSEEAIRADVQQLLKVHHQGVIRVTLSIGEGGRGYQSPANPEATRIISFHPWPEVKSDKALVLGVASLRLPNQPALAGIKHGNRLEQLLIRRSWSAEWQEALVFDQQDCLVEATQANVFVRTGSEVLTPPITQCGVAGVVRGVVLAHQMELNWPLKESKLTLAQVLNADEIVLTNSIIGARSATQLNVPELAVNKTFAPDQFTLSSELTALLNTHGAI